MRDARSSQGVLPQDVSIILAMRSYHTPHCLNKKSQKNDGIWPRDAQPFSRIVKVVYLVIYLHKKPIYVEGILDIL